MAGGPVTFETENDAVQPLRDAGDVIVESLAAQVD